MSTTEAIHQLTDLIKAGRLDLAKAHARTALATADDNALAVIDNCVTILEAPPQVALPRLRHYWKSSDEQTRSLIAACAPDPAAPRVPQQREPERTPQWTKGTVYRAARDLRTEVRPAARREPRTARGAEAERRAYQQGIAYEKTRGGVEEGSPSPRPDAYAIDYDNAARHPLRGTPCVRCWTERSSADHARQHDDGLCGPCREKGRPGIPPLTAPHTAADVVAARCAFIAEHAPPTAVHGVLRKEWARATTRAHRDAIAGWVTAHPEQVVAPTGAQVKRTAGECRDCGSYRALRNQLCADCVARPKAGRSGRATTGRSA
jgi:hypothetical protein